MISKFFLFVSSLVLSFQQLKAQGAGDTNVSMFGNIAPSMEKIEDFFTLTMSVRYDQGKNDVNSIAPYLRFDTNINEQLDFQAWITSKYAMGPLTNAFTLGDVNLVASYKFNEIFDDSELNNFIDSGMIFTTNGGKGVKEPVGNNGFYITYPMEYQSSLGTVDFFIAYTLKTRGFNLSLGLQQPLLPRNQNNFYPSYFNLGNVNPDYPVSNEMKRSGDLFTRLGYNIIKDIDQLLNLGITASYRFINDRYHVGSVTKPAYLEVGYFEVEGTKGLAANVVGQFNRRINDNVEIGIYAGAAVVQRKDYMDGLKRTFFLTPSFTWAF